MIYFLKLSQFEKFMEMGYINYKILDEHFIFPLDLIGSDKNIYLFDANLG